MIQGILFLKNCMLGELSFFFFLFSLRAAILTRCHIYSSIKRANNKCLSRKRNVNSSRTGGKLHSVYVHLADFSPVVDRPTSPEKNPRNVIRWFTWTGPACASVHPSVIEKESPRRLFDFRLWLTAESVQSLPRLARARARVFMWPARLKRIWRRETSDML